MQVSVVLSLYIALYPSIVVEKRERGGVSIEQCVLLVLRELCSLGGGEAQACVGAGVQHLVLVLGGVLE